MRTIAQWNHQRLLSCAPGSNPMHNIYDFFHLLLCGHGLNQIHFVGVTHGDDLIYLFSTGLFTFNDEDTKVRKQMVELWTNFAIYG